MPRHSAEPERAMRRVEDLRGSSYGRRARKLWLLARFGDGAMAPCAWCGRLLDYGSMEVDRFPVCGHDGGRYTRDNVVPACSSCNGTRCAACKAEAEEAEAEVRVNWRFARVDDEGRVVALG